MSLRASIARLAASAVALGASAVLAPAAEPSTNTPPARGDYAAFRIISERNIFSPSRSSRAATTPRETRRSPRVDTFALVGTIAYEKGSFAFFDGSSPEYRKVLKPGDEIAGHTLREIRPGLVLLEVGDKPIEFKVRTQMRREEGGQWTQSTLEAGTSFASSNSGSTAATAPGPANPGTDATEPGSSPSGSGGEDEVLKRLLRKREQDLK